MVTLLRSGLVLVRQWPIFVNNDHIWLNNEWLDMRQNYLLIQFPQHTSRFISTIYDVMVILYGFRYFLGVVVGVSHDIVGTPLPAPKIYSTFCVFGAWF